MAQVVLSGIGSAIGGPVGRTLGSVVGRSLDQALVAGLEPARQRGPRLEGLRVQSSADGAPMAAVFGRARVTGQVIWAARFLERRNERSAGKGGPRSVEHAYSLSFAVALCEGPIDGVGRVWADGQPLDMSGVTMRLHRGTADQMPDPLIQVVEGEASAFRGTAYVVFEDLPLGPFGNRVPQLAFEVFRRPRGSAPVLEDRLEGVCLIPVSSCGRTNTKVEAPPCDVTRIRVLAPGTTPSTPIRVSSAEDVAATGPWPSRQTPAADPLSIATQALALVAIVPVVAVPMLTPCSLPVVTTRNTRPLGQTFASPAAAISAPRSTTDTVAPPKGVRPATSAGSALNRLS